MPAITDLGTGLTSLQALWMARCGLIDLDGISCFSSLKELYLAYNEIDDLSGVSMIENLEILDLEGNNIDDIAQVEFLSLCSKLRILTLQGNPVESAPHSQTKEQDLKFYDYRHALHKAIPSLHVLDDEPFLFDIVNGQQILKSSGKSTQPCPSNLKEDLFLVQESIKAFDVAEEASSGDDDSLPDMLSCPSSSRPSSGNRRPVSSRNRPTSSRQRLATSAEVSPRDDRDSGTLSSSDHDDSSDLTHGSKQVLCGNPVRALLARRKERRKQINLRLGVEQVTETIARSIPRFTPEHSYLDEEEDVDASREDVFTELKKWRQDFARCLDDAVDRFSTLSDASGIQNNFNVSDLNINARIPTPPNAPPRQRPSGAKIRRSLPSPLSIKESELSRPNTASDFRSRRFRSKSAKVKVTEMSRSLNDENFREENVEDSRITVDSNIDVGNSPRSRSRDHWKSKSVGNGTFYPPAVEGPRSESVKITSERTNNIRPGTAKAALQRSSKKHFS